MNTIDPNLHRERGPTPVTRALRNIRERGRRRRSGVAVIIQVLLYAALVVAIIGSAIGGPALYRRIVGGGEQNVLRSNIDQVARIAEEYWTQYAADIGGRRDIDLTELCPYLNREFAGSAISLRTVAVFANTGATGTGTNTQPEADDGTNGIVDGMATNLAINATPTLQPDDTDALCPVVQGTPAANARWAANVARAATPNGGVDLYVGRAGGTGHGVSAGTLANAGLRSTRTVWMAQYNWDADNVPAGARATQGANNDVLVFGGVAPDGTSYCLIKIFSANDRAAIGEYRVAREPQAASFAVCSEGAGGATAPSAENTPRLNAGWPEAR